MAGSIIIIVITFFSGGVVLRCTIQFNPTPPTTACFNASSLSDDLDLDNILQELLELECQLGSEAGDQLVLGLPPLPQSSSNEPIATSSQHPRHDAFRSVPSAHYLPLKQQQTSVSPDSDSAFGDSNTECSSSGSNGSGISSSNAVLRTGVRFASSQQRASEVSTVGSYQGSLDTLSPSNHQV